MKSIGLKLWAGMMVLVGIVLVLLWLFQIVFLENFYNGMRISEAKKEARSIVRLLEKENKNQFENAAEAFAFNNNSSIELLDSGGNIDYSTGTMGPGGQMPMMRHPQRIEAIEKVLDGEEVTLPLIHPRFGNKFMLIGLPVYSDEFSGALLINMPLAPVEDTVTILKKQLLLITVALLIAAVIVSYIISRSFIKPILEIKRVSVKMAAGVFTDQIMSRSKDEIGELAETINYMGRELSKTEQLRKDFIANVSHELRTPLSLIRGYAETIRDVSGNFPEKRERQLGIIIEESERLSRIVDDILNLSQLQAGYLHLNMKKFLLSHTIENVTKRYDVLCESTGIQIIIQKTGELEVLADKDRIEQVLYNLITNAFNHSHEGGNITVGVMDGEDSVTILVSDTGDGIPDEDISNVWNRFYKGEKVKEKKMMGTGLGLAIVKNILDAHKVQYGVDSKAGFGTTFWFELKKF